ncbi:hypothetical protein KXW47_005429, partial [Aspergillus fumigatus]
YAKGTTTLLDRVKEKWSQFCACLRKDPREELERVSVPILFTFLDWLLNLRRGKNGRRLPGVKCKSSLDTFWKVFRLVYENETSNKIGKQMNRQMRRVIRQLAKKHKLSPKGRDKPSMDVEDLAKVVETTISTTEKKFGHGRHRIELGLFLQLAGLTTNRPQAILELRYRHIQVSLLRDPQGGPHRIIIEFTFEFTKEWLGAKDANTYVLPEIIFDPSLVLSPHVFLLGLLFADRAFDRVDGEEVLVSANQLPRLRIRDECNELRLQLDPKLDDVSAACPNEVWTFDRVTIIVAYAITARTLAGARGCLRDFGRWVDVGMAYPIVVAPRRHRRLTPAWMVVVILRKQEGIWAGQIGNINGEAARHCVVMSNSGASQAEALLPYTKICQKWGSAPTGTSVRKSQRQAGTTHERVMPAERYRCLVDSPRRTQVAEFRVFSHLL